MENHSVKVKKLGDDYYELIQDNITIMLGRKNDVYREAKALRKLISSKGGSFISVKTTKYN